MSSSGDERVPVSVAWILLAGLGAAILLTTWMREGFPRAEFPTELDGLSVISISRAEEVRALDAGSDVLVQGWFVQTVPPPCMPPDPANPIALLEDLCGRLAVLYSREDGGLSLDLFIDGADTSWAGEFGPDGRTRPTPVVVVGHFDDPRAADCQDQARCMDTFVMTGTAWVDGRELP